MIHKILLAFALLFAAHAVGEASATSLFLPTEIILLEKHQSTTVVISGDLGERGSKGIVSVTVTNPAGVPTVHAFTASGDGRFHGFYIIPGYSHEEEQRAAEGKYRVTGTYRAYDSEGNVVSSHGIGSGEFVARYGVPEHEHTIRIITDGSERCVDTGRCYDTGNTSIPIGSSVEWYNDSLTPHRIISTNPDYEFVIGVVTPGHSKSYTFDFAGSAEYSCAFHPWMTGTIKISEDAPAQSYVPIVESKPEILLSGKMDWHNAGDKLKITADFVGTGSNGANITMTDSDGTEMFSERVPIRSDGTGRFTTLTQPTWTPGKYNVTVSTDDTTVSEEVTISQHTIMCNTVQAGIDGVSLTIHGTEGDCFAGFVYNIKDHDTIIVGERDINLTVSSMEPGKKSEDVLRTMCPRGSVAVIDPDVTISSDSRDLSNIISQGNVAYFAVYCDGNPVSVNERLIENGAAWRDPTGCLTTEFEWGRCEVQDIVTETATGIVDDVSSGIDDGINTVYEEIDNTRGVVEEGVEFIQSEGLSLERNLIFTITIYGTVAATAGIIIFFMYRNSRNNPGVYSDMAHGVSESLRGIISTFGKRREKSGEKGKGIRI